MFVPPIEPTKTICLTPAALAVSTKTKSSTLWLYKHTYKKKLKEMNTNQHLSDSSDQSNQPTKERKKIKTNKNGETPQEHT